MRPIRKSPDNVPQQYSATYQWRDDAGNWHTGYFSGLFSRSDMALEHFHKNCQRHQETNAERKVVRPKLAPDQYRITAFDLVYNEVAGDEAGEERREAVQIPAGDYPDVRKTPKAQRVAPARTAEFGFVADLPKSEREQAEPVANLSEGDE